MTLHNAIEHVLRAAGRPLTPHEISAEVDRLGLYARRDGARPSTRQISARVNSHPWLFTKSDGRIQLSDPASAAASAPARADDKVAHLAVSAETARSSWGLASIESSLLDPARLRSARDIDNDVPDQLGLYAIHVRDIDALPDPFRSIARTRSSALIYLGEATRQTLKQRFLRNELRGRGHGTFFRSIGAVLGYRPPVGSLAGRQNRRNFRFSPEDTASVVEWINDNVTVSWTGFSDRIHEAEVALISAHTPLLNLRDNPAALSELSELRSLCCETATTPESTLSRLSDEAIA